MNFFFRRQRRRKNKNSLVEQFARFIRACDPAYVARRRLVVMNAARLFGKTRADIFGASRHGQQGLLHLFEARRPHGVHRLIWHNDLRSAALDMRRRRQAADDRSLALRTLHHSTLALTVKHLPRSKPAFEAVSMVAEEIEDDHLVPGAEVESAWLAPRECKSDVIS